MSWDEPSVTHRSRRRTCAFLSKSVSGPIADGDEYRSLVTICSAGWSRWASLPGMNDAFDALESDESEDDTSDEESDEDEDVDVD